MNVSDKETSALNLYRQILWRRRYEFLASVGLVVLVMAIRTKHQPKVYESSLLLLIGNQQSLPVVDQEKAGAAKGSEDLATEVEILRTLPLVSQATKSLSASYPDLDPQSIAGGLSIKQLGKGGVVSITYRDTDPQRLVTLLTQLGKTSVDFSLTTRRSQVTGAIKFIENKLPSAQQDLLLRSQQLSSFRKQHKLLNPNEVGSMLSKSLSELQQQEYTAFASLEKSQSLYNTLETRLDSLLPEQALAIASLSQDPVYLGLLKDYQEAEKLYSLQRLRFTDTAPPLIALAAKRDQLRQLLAEQSRQILGRNIQAAEMPRFNELQITQVEKLLDAENELRVQQAQSTALQTVRLELEKDFKRVPDLQQEYDDLARQVQIASSNITNLLSKLEEFRILEAQDSSIWKVIQLPYLPTQPILPNLKLNLIIGTVLGMLLGGLVVYIREQGDRRLRTLEAVQQVINLPTLGILPKADEALLHLSISSSVNSTLQSQGLYFHAAIQQLLFALKSVGATESLKSIGFTSSAAHDGKTTIVEHLGRSAADLDYRVLLIDGDLLKPELHLGFRVANVQGLSEVIYSDTPWQKAIQDTDQPNLHLLSAGATPMNPVALLDSTKMGQLMVQLRDHYDLILIDLPPTVGRSDALVSINHLDGFVFVMDINHVTREMLQVGLDSLKYASKQPLGIVCNQVNLVDIPHADTFTNNLASPGKFHLPFTQNK